MKLRYKSWRCFHCDFFTLDPLEAAAHFGDRDDAEEFKPLCKWWQRMEDGERAEAFQDLAEQLVEANEELLKSDVLPPSGRQDKWVSVETMSMEREDNCCLDPQDVERYSVPVWIWDEDECDAFKASYDFRLKIWDACETGSQLLSVTHWQPLPSAPLDSGKEAL